MHSISMESLADIRVTVNALVGRAHLALSEILALGAGSVVSLHVAATEPAPLLVNGVVVAHGEIVTLENGYLALHIQDVSLPGSLRGVQ